MATKPGRGLGKGLDSLIPNIVGETKAKNLASEGTTHAEDDKVQETLVKITMVEPNRKQPRKTFDEDSLQELSDSIKQVGLIQPILVQDKNDHYEIIAGERRWRAAKMAGIKEIPVIIRNYTEQEIMEISLIENIQRENLNPIEEALAYKKLINEFHLKQDELAERISKSRTSVTNAMRLLKLDQRVQQMVIDDLITTGHARALLGITDSEKQYITAQQIFDENLSVRETEKLIKKLQNDKVEQSVNKEEDSLAVFYEDMEQKLKSIMGTKVLIHKKSKEKGKIEIEYYSSDELERIMELFQSIHQIEN